MLHSSLTLVLLLKSVGWIGLAIISKVVLHRLTNTHLPQETGAMMALCCVAYDLLLVCQMDVNDVVSLFVSKTKAKGGPKDKAPVGRPAWVSSLVRRQVCACAFLFYATI